MHNFGIISTCFSSFITYLFLYQNLNTPLHLAAKNDHVDVVEMLGTARADVSIVNKVSAAMFT